MTAYYPSHGGSDGIESCNRYAAGPIVLAMCGHLRSRRPHQMS